MRTKKGFNLRNVCGEEFIVAEGIENIDFSNIITMNETSSFLWKAVASKEFTVDSLVRLLTDNYEVTREVAEKDATKLVNDWYKAGIIEK